jgi:hypothetical protein
METTTFACLTVCKSERLDFCLVRRKAIEAHTNSSRGSSRELRVINQTVVTSGHTKLAQEDHTVVAVVVVHQESEHEFP